MASVRNRPRLGEVAIAAAGALAWAVAAWGQAPATSAAPVLGPPEPPAGAIVWWRFDPSRFASTRGGGEAGARLFAGGLRAAVAAGLLGDGTALVAGRAMVGGLELGRAPHLAAITDFEARRGGDGEMSIRRLRAWAELGTGEDHASMLRTVRALGIDSAGDPDAAGAQRVVTLPDGGEAVAFRRSDWPEWAELGWASRPGRFAVGVGAGAMEAWSSRGGDAEAGAPPPWAAHRALAPREGEFFELWIDIGALRERYPSAFHTGRTPRMLGALGLSDARRVMVHGRLWDDGAAGPPLLDVVVTVDAGEGGVATRSLTSGRRPGGLGGALAAGGSYVVALEGPVSELLAFGLGVYEATVQDEDLAEFRVSRARYEAAQAARLAALDATLAGGVALTDWPTPPAPIPGLCTVVCELGRGVGAGEAGALVAGLLEPFGGRVDRRGWAGGGSRWSLRLDEGGLIRFPVWGVLQKGRHAALVGGWGEPVLEAAWRTLDGLGVGAGGAGGQSNR